MELTKYSIQSDEGLEQVFVFGKASRLMSIVRGKILNQCLQNNVDYNAFVYNKDELINKALEKLIKFNEVQLKDFINDESKTKSKVAEAKERYKSLLFPLGAFSIKELEDIEAKIFEAKIKKLRMLTLGMDVIKIKQQLDDSVVIKDVENAAIHLIESYPIDQRVSELSSLSIIAQYNFWSQYAQISSIEAKRKLYAQVLLNLKSK